MFRILFFLLVGISVGYFAGFKDGRKHDKNIVQRAVARVGGDARNSLNNDIDARMEKQAGR